MNFKYNCGQGNFLTSLHKLLSGTVIAGENRGFGDYPGGDYLPQEDLFSLGRKPEARVGNNLSSQQILFFYTSLFTLLKPTLWHTFLFQLRGN